MKSDIKKACDEALVLDSLDSQEASMAVLQRYSSPVIMTDKGNHYYNVLCKNYMAGIPMKDDKLIMLIGLHSYGARMNKTNVAMGDLMLKEVEEILGGNLREDQIRVIQQVFIRNGYVIKNPEFDAEFSNEIYLESRKNVGI